MGSELAIIRKTLPPAIEEASFRPLGMSRLYAPLAKLSGFLCLAWLWRSGARASFAIFGICGFFDEPQIHDSVPILFVEFGG
jgi:hypothetical protein